MNSKIISIGIDPGSIRLGYALVLFDNGVVSLKKSGVILFKKKDTLSKKLNYVFDFFKKMVLEYIGQGIRVYFSVERQYCDKNAQSSFVLVSFYSMFLLLSEQMDIHCFALMPTQIKKLITGYGVSPKQDLYLALEQQFNINFNIISLDESDAIAIAFVAILLLDQAK